MHHSPVRQQPAPPRPERAARRWPAWAAAAALVGLAACGTAPRSGGEKVALVIGNAAYDNAPPLVNPVNDAADMCAALKKLGFRTLCHVNVRDRAEFEARVQEYTALLSPNAVGVFYYSGHGVQAGNANFLIPTQAQPGPATEDPTRVLYDVDELLGRVGQKATRFQMVILDACRTDLFADAPRAAGRGLAARPALMRSLQTVARASTGLQPIRHAPPGTIVFYATASKDTAYDGEGRNGPLTKHILQHVDTQGVFVEEFIKRVTQGVVTETTRLYGRRQTPFTYGSFSGRFCFAGCPGDKDVAIPVGF